MTSPHDPPDYSPEFFDQSCGVENHQWKKVGENDDGDRFYRCVKCGEKTEV